MKTKIRKPWIAGLLSILSPAVGYAYVGKLQKGIILSFLLLFLYPSLVIFLKVKITKIALLFLVSIPIIIVCFLFFNCYKTAKEIGIGYKIKTYNKWWAYLIIYMLFGIILPSIVQNYTKNNLIQAFKIPAGSMLPTLKIGDHLLVDKSIYKSSPIQREDIIVFPMPKKPEIDYIKRVIALPGDSIEIVDKEVFINGEKQNHSYSIHLDTRVIEKDSSPRDNFGPVKIQDGNVFVMGDNRDNSYDSRFYGFIPIETIKGKFIQIYWSWDKETSSIRWNRIGTSDKNSTQQ
nr:signal peptidase I [uncultured Desulfobulbus sp.]